MKRGQVWIETVIYTLIGLSLIGIALALLTPKINEYKDRNVIEQTIESLNALDGKINEVLGAPGNVRVVEFQLKRGKIIFDGVKDKIIYELDDSRSLYSEPGVSISLGEINVNTTKGAKRHKVVLEIDYEHNLTIDGVDISKDFGASAIPYRFSVENNGVVHGRQVVDLKKIG